MESRFFRAYAQHVVKVWPSKSIAHQIFFWWVIPIAAVGLSLALLIKAVFVAFTWGNGFPTKILHENKDVPGTFAVHILAGAVALLIGPWQLSVFLRGRYPRLHRWLGRTYVVFVLISAGASVFLKPRLDIYGTGYLRIVTALLWVSYTILAVVAVRKLDIEAHRRWMIRSFAFTLMGLSLLIYIRIGTQLDLDLAIQYPAVTWLTFLTNLLFIEIMLWRAPRRASSRTRRRGRSAKPVEGRLAIPVRA